MSWLTKFFREPPNPEYATPKDWFEQRRQLIEQKARRPVSAAELHEVLYGDDNPALVRSILDGTDLAGRPVTGSRALREAA